MNTMAQQPRAVRMSANDDDVDPTQTMAMENPRGLVHAGNLPIWNRPMVQNADGSHSSEYSTSFQDERPSSPNYGKEVLIPTVVNGRFTSPDGKIRPEGTPGFSPMNRAAWQHYLKTGENLGIFDNASDANAYSEVLHNRGSALVGSAKPVIPRVDPHDTLTAPIGPAPVLPNLPAPMSQRPVPSMSMAAPKVNSPASLPGIQARTEDRLMADYSKDENPYGSPNNHPGFFGKVLHGLNVATGGENRRKFEEQGLENRLTDLSKIESAEGLQGAQAANQNSEAGKNTEETKEMPGKAASDEALQGAETGNFNSETRARDAAAALGPSLAEGYAHAVHKALSEGRDPAQDPVVQHLADAITSIQKQPAPKGLTYQSGILGPDNKPHTYALDAQGNKVADEGVHYERPITITTGDKLKGQIYKTYQPVMDSAERYNVMAKNYEDAMKNHDQQAMLSLLYNHMGMTMGLQKGARMTQDLIHEAQQSQPWLQGIKAKFDKNGYLTGVVLSPMQMREMVNNARGRYSEDVTKARNEAKYMGATDDGPARTPNSSVINYYTALAKGDPAKAKQLAAEDGWTVN